MEGIRIDRICNVYDTHLADGEEMRHGASSVLSSVELNQGSQNICGAKEKEIDLK